METYMKKLLLSCAVLFATCSSIAYADTNEKMKDSKYCMSNGSDPICMGPESMKMREEMMKMTKDNAMAARTKYCQDGKSGDPICDPKMMNDSTGY